MPQLEAELTAATLVKILDLFPVCLHDVRKVLLYTHGLARASYPGKG